MIFPRWKWPTVTSASPFPQVPFFVTTIGRLYYPNLVDKLVGVCDWPDSRSKCCAFRQSVLVVVEHRRLSKKAYPEDTQK